MYKHANGNQYARKMSLSEKEHASIASQSLVTNPLIIVTLDRLFEEEKTQIQQIHNLFLVVENVHFRVYFVYYHNMYVSASYIRATTNIYSDIH